MWVGLSCLAAVILLFVWRHAKRHLSLKQIAEAEKKFHKTLKRFHVEIDRFKFTHQRVVKNLLSHDHAISTLIEERALFEGEDRTTLRLQVQSYVEEMVPFFKPLVYYVFGLSAARRILNLLYHVEFRPEELEAIKKFAQEKPRSIVYVMNHRSNVDYVLAAYVLSEKLALSFAVGEWARVWPLEYLFKAFGSYFLRRGFRDPLYHMVLRRYAQLMTKNGVTQALFPEGGLTRDGGFRSPKLGLIDAIVCSKEDRSFSRELVFVPVAINYDRVLEDRALTNELRNSERHHGKVSMARQVFAILFENLRKFSQKQLYKNGIAAVRFGAPISFDSWHAEQGVDIFSLPKEQRRQRLATFCNRLMRQIAAKIPATPLCIVAKVLLEKAPLDKEHLIEAVEYQLKDLKKRGVDIVAEHRGAAWMVEGALLRFQSRHVVQEEFGRLTIAPAQEPIVRFYANSLRHVWDNHIPEVETPSHLQAR